MGMQIIFIMLVYIQKNSIFINNILYSHQVVNLLQLQSNIRKTRSERYIVLSAKLVELRGLLLISGAHFAF